MTMNTDKRATLHAAMGIPKARMVSMGDLMQPTKKKLKAGQVKTPKAGGKPPAGGEENEGY